MFSTADWAAPYWTNKQHIADRLSKRGYRVLYIESPGIRPPQGNVRDFSRIWERLKRAWTPPQRINSELWILAPLTIPFGHRTNLIKRFNAWLMGSVLRRWLKRHGKGDMIVWAYHPYIEGAYENLQRKALVYHCVDDLAVIPGVDAEAFRAAETVLAQSADVVFATSPHLKAHCEALGAVRCIYERNVADIDHFAQARLPGSIPDDLVNIKGPKLCYTGVLSDYKLDLDLIKSCALARPDINWIFIGDEPERQSNPELAYLHSLPNVHFLGYRAYDELPNYLRSIDIAILPNLTMGYMKGVFPMKFYEYVAAGKPVIATPIDSLVTMCSSAYIAGTTDDWLRAIDACLKKPPAAVDLADKELRQFDWESRLDRMLACIALA
ncbi:glycosyltransferase family 1 protein [Rhizobium sp. CG4]|nr:glycosyltransferase family 1 protein [Rhizobium sp. CG4]